MLTCTWEKRKKCYKLQYRSKRDILENKIVSYSALEKNGEIETIMVECFLDYKLGWYAKYNMTDQST